MTRINVGLLPSTLCDQHLMAEHREIKRIPNTVKSGKANLDNIPSDFRLGSGHVKFFYNKLGYLKRRYKQLLIECRARGFDVTDYSEAFEDIPDELMQYYHPTPQDRALVMERVMERLGAMKRVTYTKANYND